MNYVLYSGKCFCIKYDSQIKFLVIPLKNIWINELQRLTKLRVKQINRTYTYVITKFLSTYKKI